jgi:hypothetical protein
MGCKERAAPALVLLEGALRRARRELVDKHGVRHYLGTRGATEARVSAVGMPLLTPAVHEHCYYSGHGGGGGLPAPGSNPETGEIIWH